LFNLHGETSRSRLNGLFLSYLFIKVTKRHLNVATVVNHIIFIEKTTVSRFRLALYLV